MSTNDLFPELNITSFDLNSLVEGTDYLSGQVIVKLKPGIESTQIQTLPETLQASVLASTNTLGTQLWQLNGLSVAQAISTYSNHPLIEYIEPNYTISLNTTIPKDSSFNQLWGLNNTGQTGGIPDADIDAPEAWDSATGNNVVIGVIDTGVDYTHPDLNDNMWTNPGEIPGDGIDNDGNGYVDDYYGWDFANNDSDPWDDQGHGTHVAGTIAAEGNNNIGVIGVAPNAKIMALKWINANGGGDTFDAIQAVEYATMMGVKVTNNSWRIPSYSQGLYDAIAAAGQAGQLFIAAAGNGGFDGIGDNNDVTPHYPSNYDLDNIICVAATDDYDNLASFSNYGVTSVDLGAPGVDIYSTIPGGGYASKNGTSMATPHVSGVAALIWSQNPQLSASEVKNQILSTVDPISSLQGNTVTGGRLNANNALLNNNPGISLPINLYDSSGYLWDISTDGHIVDGSSDAYDSGLSLNGFPTFTTAQTEDNGREIVIGSATIGDVEVTRKIYVPADQSFARFLEIVTNTSSNPLTYTVNLDTNLGSDSSTVGVGTSSGDTLFDTTDNWIVTDDSDGTGDPTLLHVIAGSGSQRPTAVSAPTGYLNYDYDLMLNPGETQIVMHFAAQNPNRVTALTKGNQLAELGLNALAGMSQQELQQVVNFSTIQSPGEIHGSKWNDIDGDGRWDANEPGLSGWTIYLDQNQNSQLDAGEVSTITDINGNYSFTGLTADTYTVAEVLLPGWQQTVPGSEPSFKLVAGTGSGGTNEFSLVELQTDPVAEILIGSASYNPGLDIDPTTGLLYGASSSLRIIDPTDGSYSTIGTIHSATESSILMKSLAFSPNGTLYGISNSTDILYTIDPGNAFATKIGTVPQYTRGIDFAPDGTLYGAWNNLVKIDPTTGNILATIGSLGTYILDIDFAPDGLIYGVYDTNRKLDQIDPSDASKTVIGTYQSKLWGVASIPSTSNLIPGTHTINLNSGEIITNINFGNQQIQDLSPQLNFSFETGDFTDWNSIGDATIQTATICSTPTDGTFQALITNGQGSVSDSNLETFLGLNPGDLDNLGNGDVIEGSALQLTPITVKTGDIISFDWNFITNEQTPSDYNDFGFVSISSTLLSELADTNQSFSRFTGSFGKQTNYGTFEYQFTQAGTYTIGLGLVDADDSSVDSGLLVDHVQITPDPFFNFGFETGDCTNWTTIGNTTIETNSIGSNPTEGNYQAFITNGVGSVSDAEMETFFGLITGALDNLGNGDVIEGSGLQFQPIKVQAGDSISFDWNLITNEENPSSFRDFGFVSITSGVLSELADTSSNFSRFTGSFGSQTGYGTFTHQFTESGIFTIGVGLMDSGDSYVDSGLLIDNFSFTSNSGTNLGLSTSNATVDTVTPEYTIQGTPDNDKLVSSNQQGEIIFADAGNDTVIGSLGNDVIYGAAGDDILRGDLNKRALSGAIAGDDILYGGSGNDKLYGKGGNDQLFGEEGNDKIWGEDGDDLLWGGLGNDQLIGGQGSDIFVLAVGEGTDKIRDFQISEDFVGLSGELTFDQLSISQHGKNTWIDFNDETLAVLTGVNASTLTVDSFVLI